MAAENDRAAKIAIEGVELAAVAGEILLEERRRHVVHLLGCVDRAPRFPECFLVDVGRVDLDSLSERVDADGLGEEHCGAVSFLP